MANTKKKRYRVTITRDTIVEAQNEDEAQDLAFDSLIFGDVDFEVEEEEEEKWKKLKEVICFRGF